MLSLMNVVDPCLLRLLCVLYEMQNRIFQHRVPAVRLISCLPETNKGMDKDYLIISSDWHDGLHCPT